MLSGEAHLGAKELQARRRGGGGRQKVPLERSGARFTARMPLGRLGADDAIWDLYAGRRRVTLDLGVPAGAVKSRTYHALRRLRETVVAPLTGGAA